VSRIISALLSARRFCSLLRLCSPSSKGWKSHEVGKPYTHPVGRAGHSCPHPAVGNGLGNRAHTLGSALISRVSTRKLANSRTDNPSSQHKHQLLLSASATAELRRNNLLRATCESENTKNIEEYVNSNRLMVNEDWYKPATQVQYTTCLRDYGLELIQLISLKFSGR
jgi:hypothetical protein